jgi:hypothetical protein
MRRVVNGERRSHTSKVLTGGFVPRRQAGKTIRAPSRPIEELNVALSGHWPPNSEADAGIVPLFLAWVATSCPELPIFGHFAKGRVSSARGRMSEVLPLRRTNSSSFANLRNCFDAQQKSHRAVPPPRVVVSHDHIPAVKKHYVRAGGN